jgi:membrane protein YfhO
MTDSRRSNKATPTRPWPSRIRPNIVVALLFAALAVIELWTPIVHGGYLLPGDFGQLWTITKIPHGPHVPHNPLQGDVYDAFGPFLHFDVAQANAGHLATWDPYNGNGQPYLADAQTVVVSPFTLPFYFLGFRLALIAAALARLWFLGFFTYLFLARHRLRRDAAVIGGILFAYAGYHIVWLEYQTHVSVSATLPVALWCLRTALDHGRSEVRSDRARAVRTAALAGMSIALGVMILDGHPETAVFDSLLIFSYALIAILVESRDWRSRLWWARRIAAVAVLGLGISAIQLLPFLQYSGEGTRTAQSASNPAMSVAGFQPDTAPLMAFPDLFGAPQARYYDTAFFARNVHQDNYVEVDANSVGLLALCLVPLGLVGSLRRRLRTIARFGIGATVLGSILLYTRWAGLLWHHLPLVGTAELIRSQDIQLMGIAVLSAMGVDWVLRSAASLKIRSRATNAALVSFGLVTLMLVLLAQNLRHLVAGLHGSTANSGAAIKFVQSNLNFEVLVAVTFVVILLLMTLQPHVVLRAAATLGLVLLAFLANGGVMQSFNTTVPSSLFYPRTPAVKQLTRIVGQQEVLFASGSFPTPETNLWFDVHDVGSYDSIGLQWHDALYGAVFDNHNNPHLEQMPKCIEGLQVFGVQWIVGGPGQWRDSKKVGLTTERYIKHVPIYNVTASNLVGVDDQVINATGGDKRAIARVSSCTFHSDSTVVLDRSPFDRTAPGKLSKAKGSTTLYDSAKITHRSDNTLSVVTKTPTGGWLVIRQSYAPGWTASVDGKPAAVLRADVAFQAVRVPAGRHSVMLAYRPSTVTQGTQLSIVAALIALSLLVVSYWWWRSSAKTVPSHAPPGAGTAPPAPPGPPIG